MQARVEMIVKLPGETFRQAKEREDREEFAKHQVKWMANAPRDVLFDLDGRPLYCERCFAYLGSTRGTHRCPADGGTQDTPFTTRP